MIFLLAGIIQAQQRTLERQYVPIIHPLSKAPLFEMQLMNWTAYAYDAQADSWQAVPFQFDKLDDKGRYDTEPDSIADASDELCLLPEHLGDHATASDWLDDPATQFLPRMELEFEDPLNPGEKGWVYLYRNVSSDPELPDYLSYKPGPQETPAADTIRSTAYTLGHNREGWMDYLSLAQNRDTDLIDRFKLRLAGDMLIGPEYEINENFVEATTDTDQVEFYDGPVRAFHKINAEVLIEKLGLPLLPKRADFDYHFQYFPYSFQIAAETNIDATMLTLFGVQLIRQSLDLSQNAVGMHVYSAQNRDGMLVDGSPDNATLPIPASQEQNWVMASGPQGTILVIFEISPMKNSNKQLYYNDNKDGSAVDGTEETGTPGTYGDMGVMVKATGSALITQQLTVTYKGYFVNEANQDVTFGEQLIEWVNNPLTLTATEQIYDPSSVHNKKDQPQTYELAAVYPNPFNPKNQPFTQIEFRGLSDHVYDLVIYNVLGQQVVEFKNLRATKGLQSVRWDGLNHLGMRVRPGTYFCKLSGGSFSQTQKVIVQY